MIVNLFGKDKGGKYKVWNISTWNAVNGDAVLTIQHGQEGGKLTRKDEVIAKGKQGRTPAEQAVSEAEGRIKKQLDKNYRHTKEELDNLPVLPMLAGDYNKIGHRINYAKGVYLSDKLDGVRMMAKCLKDGTITLESRTGQPYILPHIVEELKGIMQPGDILDGEAYLHGHALQDITSAVKRTDPEKKVASARKKMEKACGSDHDKFIEAQIEYAEAIMIEELRPKLQFVIFAVIESEHVSQDMPFSEVVLETIRYKGTRAPHSSFIKFIEYGVAVSEEEMKAAHKDAVGRGFEGIMIRNADGVNESGKRSADLQKYKEFLDSEFEILDVVPNKDDGSAFLVQNDLNAETFSVTLGSMDQRAEFLANKELYIGKLITVQYQARYKDTLKPQFPTGKAIRDYE